MPQMMPLSWILIITFTIMFLIFTNTFIYFNHLPNILKINNYLKNNTYWQWKW